MEKILCQKRTLSVQLCLEEIVTEADKTEHEAGLCMDQPSHI